MIDLFTATGHIHYSKSARLDLQTIALIYQIKFAEEAYHSCPGSRYWACIWTGLVTEQVVM